MGDYYYGYGWGYGGVYSIPWKSFTQLTNIGYGKPSGKHSKSRKLRSIAKKNKA